jgi:hypothetical protein
LVLLRTFKSAESSLSKAPEGLPETVIADAGKLRLKRCLAFGIEVATLRGLGRGGKRGRLSQFDRRNGGIAVKGIDSLDQPWRFVMKLKGASGKGSQIKCAALSLSQFSCLPGPGNALRPADSGYTCAGNRPHWLRRSP